MQIFGNVIERKEINKTDRAFGSSQILKNFFALFSTSAPLKPVLVHYITKKKIISEQINFF